MSVAEIRTINVSSLSKDQIIEITKDVANIVVSSGKSNGLVNIFIPHTTAGITINENADPDVKKDMLMGLEDIVSETLPYRHAEGNSLAHIKASIMGSSVSLFIENSKLILGTWQGIYFCEFDGPRDRKVFIKIIEG